MYLPRQWEPRDGLSLTLADTGVKVGSNTGNINIPKDGAKDPEATLTALVTTVDSEVLGGMLLVAGEGVFT